MPVEFCCPIYREPLDRSDPARWVGIGHGEVYPVIEGIPVLLPDRADRQRVEERAWEKPQSPSSSPIDFYNRAEFEEFYAAENLLYERREQSGWTRLAPRGNSLEIGSGKGAIQGIVPDAGGEYVALDYSFTALLRYIDPKHHRVCATAEQLPFPDESFSLLYTVAALEHVPRADLAMQEIDRVLAPGGIAYLAPAWHTAQWVCDGVRVRPWKDLNWRQRWVKLTLPIRRNRFFKAAGTLPKRTLRRMLAGPGSTSFRYRRLKPDYEHFWESDCDACSSLDSHEACMFFASRDYEMFNPSRAMLTQLLFGHAPIVVRKPLKR